MYGIDVTHGREIAKDNLFGAYSDDRTIGIEEFLNNLALAEA